MTKSPRIRVGRYAMNKTTVELWLDPSTEDSYATSGWTESSGYCVTAVVGCLDKCWAQLVRALLHELVEYSAVLHKAHYHPSGILLPVPVDSYIMVLDHPQFTQVINEAGDALAYALPDMEKAWKKWKKEK